MSSSTAIPLRYVLPTTALTLTVTLRLAVEVDDQGGHLEPEVAVVLSAPWHPQPLTSARKVRVSSGAAASDPLGLSGSVPASSVPGSLRRAFDRAHPRTAALISDLSARSEQYLAGLRMGEESSQVVTFGQALEVVHRELAAADRTRREWISRQARVLKTWEGDLAVSDMITVTGTRATLPPETVVPEGRATDLARDYGLLLALTTDTAAGVARSRTESAGVAIYRRPPESMLTTHASDTDPEWVRDDALSRLWLADASEPGGEVPHQRVSPETERAVAAYAVRALTGDPDLEAAVRAARTQLDLLDASDEYSRLASTQYRADEIAALQHTMRLAYMPRQRAGD